MKNPIAKSTGQAAAKKGSHLKQKLTRNKAPSTFHLYIHMLPLKGVDLEAILILKNGDQIIAGALIS